MKIVEPSYEILQCPDGEECLAFIEKCGRTCYKSEGNINHGVPCGAHTCGGVEQTPLSADCPFCQGTGWHKEPSSYAFVRKIIKRGHLSVLEHMVITARFIVDRGVSHEMVRHRIASFSQESTRFVRYDGAVEGRALTFVRTPFFRECADKCGKCEECRKYKSWVFALNTAAAEYNLLLDLGAKPEEARSVLPNSLKTELVWTCNLREWRSVVFIQRSSANPGAHVQMRQVIDPFRDEMRRRIPIVFDELI